MSPREEFATALRAAVGNVSVRTLAKQVGWARSTIQDWLKGIRVPSADRLDDLLGAIGCPGDVRENLHDLREQAQAASVRTPNAEPATAEDTESSAGHDSETREQPTSSDEGSTPSKADGPTRSHRRALVLGAAIAVAAALFVSGFLTGRATRDQQVEGSRPVAVEARVANTENTGLFTYQGPSNKTPKVSSLAEGDLVGVVCVVVSVPVTDRAMNLTRSVWALLSTGTWVPDMYLDLDKSWVPPQPPPPPLHIC